jgi:glutathione S-transferase
MGSIWSGAMRVFHREHTGRPLRVTWTLEELGQPYELTVMNEEEGASETHYARHPLGRVPVLEDDEGFVFESAAICLHLADLYPAAELLPAPGTHARALAYQWTVFAPTELEPRLIQAARLASGDPERAASARRRFDDAAAAVSDALGDEEFLVGGRFTVADVMIATAIGFTARMGIADELPSNLRDYTARLARRPAFQRSIERTSG